MKEWIRNAAVLKKAKKANCYKVNTNFVLPGVYVDPPENKTEFVACQNTLMLLFNHGYYKFKRLKSDIENPGLNPHGLTNKMANFMIKNVEDYKEINESLKVFFESLVEQAETHATRVVRTECGVTLRDEEIDTVELPSSMTLQ